MEVILESKGLTKSFKSQTDFRRTVFSNLSFQIKSGSKNWISGQNGSGKTSLLRCLSAILDADSGSLYFRGAPYHSGSTQIRAKLGYCPAGLHSIALNSSFREQCYFLRRLWNVPQPRSIPLEIVEQLGLQDVQDQLIFQLSSGYRRRIAIALTLSLLPEVLFLDEPFAHLDAQQCEALDQLLSNWAEKNSRCVVVSSPLKLPYFRDWNEIPLEEQLGRS